MTNFGCVQRLQLFGFLAAPEVEEREDANLNAGLLDQRAALRWVNRNIASIGGDPDKVSRHELFFETIQKQVNMIRLPFSVKVQAL